MKFEHIIVILWKAQEKLNELFNSVHVDVNDNVFFGICNEQPNDVLACTSVGEAIFSAVNNDTCETRFLQPQAAIS